MAAESLVAARGCVHKLDKVIQQGHQQCQLQYNSRTIHISLLLSLSFTLVLSLSLLHTGTASSGFLLITISRKTYKNRVHETK